MSNAPDLVGILKSVVAMQTPCWSDRLYPAHKFQETRSPFALDLLHCSGKISLSHPRRRPLRNRTRKRRETIST